MYSEIIQNHCSYESLKSFSLSLPDQLGKKQNEKKKCDWYKKKGGFKRYVCVYLKYILILDI